LSHGSSFGGVENDLREQTIQYYNGEKKNGKKNIVLKMK
jgi:hypothetical protein